ncbi:MAG: aldo/keto reductase [Novosphingobium sp.]|nr:aldo/keto reductase [Novosphingobium sp.]
MERMIGGRMVEAIGLGCMNVNHAYAAAIDPAAAIALFRRAVECGYRHFDTSRLYGGGINEQLVGEALKSQRDRVFLASKMGIFVEDRKRWIDCRPQTIRAELEKSLRALQTDHIDLYYMHRRDFDTPIEESALAMADLIREGKIGSYGLSEMSAETLRRAHAVAPVGAMQTEYSLMTRNVEIGVLEAARELGVALVAFSPVGRGALADAALDPSGFGKHDLRHSMPRFNAENWPRNVELTRGFAAIAREEGVTPAQLSLGWVLSRGEHVHAIPGTSSMAHMEENIARAGWMPGPDTVRRLDALINQQTVAGPRYSPGLQATIDTEEFA